jgi:phage pi2 protein 07
VNVSTLADKSENPFKQKVLINRVEYADGSIWQRKGWSLADVKASYERVLREQWLPGMCKGL